MQGTEDIKTVQCDQTANICAIKVPAPSFALVFLTNNAFTENSGAPSTTFATTALTKTANTVTIDSAVLATSNGHSGMENRLGSTSKGSANGAFDTRKVSGFAMLLAMISGGVVLGRALMR